MNTEIYIEDLKKLGAPAVIPLSKKYFPRMEICAVCKTHLVESLCSKNNAPKDVMRIQFGRTYDSWIEGKEVFCPSCKLVYKHPLTNLDILKRYVANAESMGILSMKLKEDFSFSRFEPENTITLSKDDIVYVSSISPTERLYELKEGYTEESAYNDLGNSKFAFKMKKNEAWNEITAIPCHLSLIDLFKGIVPMKIPADLLIAPKLKNDTESQTE